MTFTGAELALCESEQRFRSAFAHAAIGMAITDRAGRFVEVNAAFCRIAGYDAPDLAAIDFPFIVHPEDRAKRDALLERLFTGEIPSFISEQRLLKQDGGLVWVRDSASLAGEPGDPARVIVLTEDITQHKAAQEAASQLASIVQCSEDAIIAISLCGSITCWSHGAEKLLGFTVSKALGMPVENLLPPLDGRHDVLDLIERVSQGQGGPGETHRVEDSIVIHDCGNAIPAALTISPIRTNAGEIAGVAMLVRDIRDRKRTEQQLEHMAWHDPVTGLPNRELLADRLEHAIACANKSARMVGVIYIDLDGFKFVNDCLGHEVGDLLLQQVAERLNTHVRPTDTLARMGGDEFMLVVTEMSDSSGPVGGRAAGRRFEGTILDVRPPTLHHRQYGYQRLPPGRSRRKLAAPGRRRRHVRIETRRKGSHPVLQSRR